MPDFFASHLLVDQLLAEGTRFIFGTPRSNQSPVVLAALEKEQIQFVEALHESVASGIGIGYAQASGRPGVVSLPAAPGLLASLDRIYEAQLVRVPLVILSEQPDSETLNDEPPLSADVLRLTAPLCKWSCQVNTVTEIPRVVRRAFHEALSPPKGPVLISLPINLAAQPSSPRAVPVPQVSPLGGADANFLKKAAKLLVEAKMPCIIAGNEVSHYRARTEVVLLSDVLGCPVFVEPLPTGVNFPNRHPLFASVLPHDAGKANALLKHFDLVLALGIHTRPPSRPYEPPFISTKATVLQINIEPGLHGRVLPNDLSATADIKESVSRLRGEVQLTASAAWIDAAMDRATRTKQSMGESKLAYEQGLTYPNHVGKISYPWFLRSVEAIRPNQSVIVNDLHAAEPHAMAFLSLENSFAYFSSNSGVLGYGPSSSIGIALASPQSTIICLTDDQSLLSYPQVLWTATLKDLNLKFIVVNSYGSKSFNIQLSAKRPACEIGQGLRTQPVSFAELARSVNLPYLQASEMGALEKQLKALFEDRRPQILEVILE